MLNLNSKLLGGAAVALLATVFAVPAQAQITELFAGGATFPEKVYRDVFNCYGDTDSGDTTTGLTAPANTCSAVSPYNANVIALYLGVGSGNGKKGFINHDSSKFTDGPRTPDAVPVGSTTNHGPYYGTGGGATWVRDTTDSGPFYPKVSFAGSDDPLTTADMTTYDTNKVAGNWGNAIQFPTMIGTVAIPFKQTATWLEKGAAPAGWTSKVSLTTNLLCGIFTGNITDWSDPAFKPTNGGQTLGNGPIVVHYRSDGSGTTFLFVNALINQCALTSNPIPATWQDAGPNSPGVSHNSWFKNVKDAGLLPASFVGVSGNGGMETGISGTVGGIGYISPDFVLPQVAGGLKSANLQTYYTLFNSLTPVFKSPKYTNAPAIFAGATPPSFVVNSCDAAHATGTAPFILSTGPGAKCAQNPLNWGIARPTPMGVGAYPIGGFTFVDTYTCFASASDVSALAGTTVGQLGLWRWYFGTATENGGKVKAGLNANGFSLLPASWIGAAKKLLITEKTTKLGIPGQLNTGCSTLAPGGGA